MDKVIEQTLGPLVAACDRCGEKSLLRTSIGDSLCLHCGCLRIAFSDKEEAVKFAWSYYKENCLYAGFPIPNDDEFQTFAAEYGDSAISDGQEGTGQQVHYVNIGR